MTVKRKLILIVLIAVTLVCAAASVWGVRYFSENPFSRACVFSEISVVAVGDDGTTVVVDQSKRRITVLNPDYEVTAVFTGDKRANGFCFAEYAVIHDGSIYVSDVVYTAVGTQVETERVMRFSMSGEYQATVFEQAYDASGMPRYLGKISSLRAGDQLTFLLKGERQLSLYRIDGDEAHLVRTVDNVANIRHTLYDEATDAVLVSTKEGVLYRETEGAFSPVMDWSGSAGEKIYWDMAASDGACLAADIGGRAIVSLDGGGVVIDCAELTERAQFITRLSANGNTVAFSDGETAYITDLNGSLTHAVNGAPYAQRYFFTRLSVWLAAAYLAVLAAILLVHIVRLLVRSQLLKQKRVIIALELTIILTTVVVSASIIGGTTERFSRKNYQFLMQTAASLSGTSGHTFGDSLRNITTLADYGGEDYLNIRKHLDTYCDSAFEQGSNLYYLLHKNIEGVLFAVVEYEDTIGTLYPTYPYADSGYSQAVEENKVIYFEAEADALGLWSFAVAPVYDSTGAVVGLIEIGIDMASDQAENNRQIQRIVLATAVAILLLLLLFSEGSFIVGNIASFRASSSEDTLECLRPIAFLMFFADSTGGAFVPQLSEQLFLSSNIPLSSTLGAAIPMSTQYLFVAVFAYIGGHLMERLGQRRVLLCGLIIQAAGYVVAAGGVASGNFALFTLGMALGGCGMGAAVVACNTLPMRYKDDVKREKLFANFNAGLISGVIVGVAMGSYIAEWMSYPIVFLVSSLVSVGALSLGAASIKKTQKSAVRVKKEADASRQRYAWDWGSIAFFVFLLLPFLMLMYFKEYTFPLFASLSGMTDSDIGNVMLFSGIIAIYLGPPMSEFALKRIGAKWASALSFMMFCIALALFGILGGTTFAIIAVIIVAFAGAFGLNTIMVYFTKMPFVLRYGESRSMGVYNMFDNIGQALAPMVLGAALILGFARSSLLLACAGGVLLLLFCVTTREKREVTTTVPAAPRGADVTDGKM